MTNMNKYGGAGKRRGATEIVHRAFKNQKIFLGSVPFVVLCLGGSWGLIIIVVPCSGVMNSKQQRTRHFPVKVQHFVVVSELGGSS